MNTKLPWVDIDLFRELAAVNAKKKKILNSVLLRRILHKYGCLIILRPSVLNPVHRSNLQLNDDQIVNLLCRKMLLDESNKILGLLHVIH